MRHPASAGIAPRLAAIAVLLAASSVVAQQAPPALPQATLTVVFPPGVKAGGTAEVVLTGADLEEPAALLAGHPGIKAEVIPPPPPPVAEPGKPAPPPQPPQPPKFKVTTAPDVPPGVYDLRFVGKWGVSNPRAFVVGDQNELAEKEPNNDLPEAQKVEVGTTVSGSIANPVDVDFFTFAAKKGQRVLVSCLASSVDSRMTPELKVYDPAGRQVAAGKVTAGTDTLADVAVPEDGDYAVRLAQFTYTQGTPEFFYRLSISTAPWVDAAFPPSVEPGKPAQVTLYGRNLPGGVPDPTAQLDGKPLEKLTVTITPPADPLRLASTGRIDARQLSLDGFEYRVKGPGGVSNPVFLTFASGPVTPEKEPNDTAETAQPLPAGGEGVGTITKRGDKDFFAFDGKKGEAVMIELLADRLGTPGDFYFGIRDAKGAEIAEHDDPQQPLDISLHPTLMFTRSSDPAPVRFVPPADGKYLVVVGSRDSGSQFGPKQVYRLRVGPERPDYRLAVAPGSDGRIDAATLHPDGTGYLDVFVFRQDGFNGPVTVTAEGLPAGVTCPPQVAAPGERHIALAMSVAPGTAAGLGNVTVRGTATIAGKPAVRVARPASAVWGVQPGQNIPALVRLNDALPVAVREPAYPFKVELALDKPVLKQGENGNVTVKLTRAADFKNPVAVAPLNLFPVGNPQLGGFTLNNNGPLTIAPDKGDGVMVLAVKPTCPPGVYHIHVKATAPYPFAKDPKATNKPPVTVAVASLPVVVTVQPVALAKVTATVPNGNVKIGGPATTFTVKAERLFDYEGPYTVKLVLPANAAGVTAPDVTIPAGKDEATVTVTATAAAMPVNLANLSVQVVAPYDGGKLPVSHEVKVNLNVVK